MKDTQTITYVWSAAKQVLAIALDYLGKRFISGTRDGSFLSALISVVAMGEGLAHNFNRQFR